jgi:hypothetical protein
MSLGPRPGGRVKSVVSAPKGPQRRLLGGPSPSGGMVDLDESSDDDDDPVTNSLPP